MDPHVVESEVLRRFYSDIQDVIVHPIGVAAQLLQEGVVAEAVVDEVGVSGRTKAEKSAAIMRSVGAAVSGDPKNLLVFISVLDKYPESAPVARKMRDALDLHQLATQRKSDTTSDSTPVTTGELNVSEVYKRDFDTIQIKFVNLVLQVSAILKKSHVSLKKLKRLLTSFPILRGPLKNADTIDKVMQVVQQHSSFINCSYLEAITDCFSIPWARREIDAYYKFVEEFCHHTLTQHSYVTSFLAKQSIYPLSSETITLKLEWKPDEKTLADIQGLLRKTFHSLASHIHIVVIGGGSVTVICYAPQFLMGALVKLAKESRKTLVANSVTYLSVGYAVLLDNSDQEEVPVLEDQVFTLKQENAALQVKFNALHEKNQMLQSHLTQLMETEQEIFQLKPYPGARGRGVPASQEQTETMLQAMEVQEGVTPSHGELIGHTKSHEMPTSSHLMPAVFHEMRNSSHVTLIHTTPALYKYMMEQHLVKDINMMGDASADVVEEILQGLRHNTSLTDLELGSYLTAENMTMLSASLVTNNNVRHLGLSCDLDHAVEQLSAGLCKNTSVRTLHLRTNDTGARHLATMLTVNTTLHTLKLGGGSISDNGVHHLSKGLQHNSSVTHLNLSYSVGVTSAGAVALSDMMKVNRSIEMLFLHQTSVGGEGADALMKALRENGVVNELRLPKSLEAYCRNHRLYDKVKHRVNFYY